MTSHEIDYRILGDDMQLVEIALDPEETIIAEAGAMNYMDDGIHHEARLGDGSSPSGGVVDKLLSAGKRALTGDSLFLTHFRNDGSGKRIVAFAGPIPGKIVPLNLAEAGDVICQKDAFLCAALGTRVDIAFTRRLGAGFFGGEGFILQRLTGDGMAFFHVGGTVIERELRGDTLFVDTGCLAAFTEGIEYDIRQSGNLKTMMFGGEGLFVAALKGHGKVWIQSLPFSRLARRTLSAAGVSGGINQKGEGSPLGNLGRMFMGDG